MDATVEKLTKEIESLEVWLRNQTESLADTRESFCITQSKIKEMQDGYSELAKQQQKILEDLEKAKKKAIDEANVLKEYESNLQQISNSIQSKKEQIIQYAKAKDEEKKAAEFFAKTPEGTVYERFKQANPGKNNYTIEWAYYLNNVARNYEAEWNSYKDAEIKAFRGGILDNRIFSTYYFPQFPGLHIGPHESDVTNKINDGRNNFHRCYQWIESNKQKLANAFAAARAEAERQQQRMEKANEAAQKQKEEEEKKSAIFREAVIKLFLEKVGNTISAEEADAILGKFHEPQNLHYLQSLGPSRVNTSENLYLWKNVFKQDSLLAMKVCNRFAQQNEIRVEDAMSLFKEYAAIKYTVPNQTKNTGIRNYIRDVNC